MVRLRVVEVGVGGAEILFSVVSSGIGSLFGSDIVSRDPILARVDRCVETDESGRGRRLGTPA